MVDETGKNSDDMPDWDDLQGMWQDTPPVDMAKMARSAKFVWWRMRINFALEIVFSIIGVVLFGSFTDFVSLPATTLGIVGMLYCGLTFWAAIHIRRGAWEDPGESALSLVQLQIRRAKSMLLYLRINSWFGFAGITLVPLGYWVLYERFGSFDHERINSVHWIFGAMVLFLLAFPLVTLPLKRRKEREIFELSVIEEQLLENDQ